MGEWLRHPLQSLHSRREYRQAMQILHGDGVSRRLLLRRGASVGLGLTVGVGLLAACRFPNDTAIDPGEPLAGDAAKDPVSKTLNNLNAELQKNTTAKKIGESVGTAFVVNQVKRYGENGYRKKITVQFSESDPRVVTAIETAITSFNINPDHPDDIVSGIVGQRRARLNFDPSGDPAQATLISQYTVRVTGKGNDSFMQFTDRYAASPDTQTTPLELAVDKDLIDSQHSPAPIDEIPKRVLIAPFNENALYLFENATKESINSLA